MSETQRYLVLDYETRSEADLRKTGSYEYSLHPSTQILCASWRLGTRRQLREEIENEVRPQIWSSAFPNAKLKTELFEALTNENIKIIAHNALFEQVITRNTFSRMVDEPSLLKNIPSSRWICTASMAAALALPRNLEGACSALNLPIQKDMVGRRLILKYCKPRKPSKNNPAKWHSSVRDLRRIMEYCQNDVDAETLLFLSIPELSEQERKVWLLDQKINLRGFLADRELVGQALLHIEAETKYLNKETRDITLNELISTTQRNGVLGWLQNEGVFLPDLRAKTVRDAISEGLVDGDTKRILQIRQAVSKTSTAKYQAFEMRSRSDGRVRDILVYHTASTGRWGGAGVQPQNFPRGIPGLDTDLASSVLANNDLEFVRLIYGEPMNVLSSCLRSVIISPKERKLFCADYANIEARVLFWAAKHASGLKAFEKNQIYEEMAAIIFNVPIEKVTKAQRQVGKQALLGCGYGMGWKKFIGTCKNFSIEIDEQIAQAAVSAYRETHYPVVKLWSMYEKAAIAATKNPGKRFTINYTSWWVEKLPYLPSVKVLWCKLPSGRKLAYLNAEVKYEPTPWGDRRPVLYHWGVNPLTRKWESSGTYGGRLCENVIQAIARDLMAEAMLRIEDAGYDIILSVHDEIVAEGNGFRDIKGFENLMAHTPIWAEGCPIAVEGWSGERYHK